MVKLLGSRFHGYKVDALVLCQYYEQIASCNLKLAMITEDVMVLMMDRTTADLEQLELSQVSFSAALHKFLNHFDLSINLLVSIFLLPLISLFSVPFFTSVKRFNIRITTQRHDFCNIVSMMPHNERNIIALPGILWQNVLLWSKCHGCVFLYMRLCTPLIVCEFDRMLLPSWLMKY